MNRSSLSADRTRVRVESSDAADYRFLGEDGQWYDEKGEPPCFVAGTPILTPTGPTAIERLRPGDSVVAWDVRRRRRVVDVVIRTKRRAGQEVGEITFADGRRLRVTRNHPFYVDGLDRWTRADGLVPGQRVLIIDDKTTRPLPIRSIAFGLPPVEVYNVKVRDTGTYFANGVLVHNY